MADVFISYAHEDAAAAERLATALEALGLTVWWDRSMVSGQHIHAEVTKQLDEAKAVIALWSSDAVKSEWVAAEAHAAYEDGKLASVKIADCRPPVFFRALRFEDLSGWGGDTADRAFQRLAIQVAALAKGQAAADALPFDGETAAHAPSPADVTAAEETTALPARAAGLLGITVALTGMALYFSGVDIPERLGPYWEALLVLVTGVFALFYYADRVMPEGPKALVRRWLSARPGERPLSSAQAFQAMFVAVFGERHLTWRCFSRSALTTIIVYSALVALFVDWTALGEGVENVQRSDFNAFDEEFYSLQSLLAENALILLIVLPLTNIIVDYVSLWETRTVLGWTTRSLPLALGAALDFLLTAGVFLLVLPIGPMLVIAGAGGFSPEAMDQAINFAPNIWRGFWAILRDHPLAELDALLRGEASVVTTTMLIAFATTFITSLWFVLALLFAPLVRLVAGIPLFGALIGARPRPIAALGGVAASLLAAGGVAASGGVQLTGQGPEGAFRDCPSCPLMVPIPGGRFTMGSPEDEKGRSAAEGPQREVTIAPFAMGVYEVTFREWAACVTDGFCESNPRPRDYGFGRGRRPVVGVSWNDITGAGGFIAWLNSKVEGFPYRVPSEAEWEYATRAGTTTHYWMGDEIDYSQANFIDGSPDFAGRARRQTVPVGAFAPNPFGLYDVHGNVGEWTQDCWNSSLDAYPKDGSAQIEGDCSRAVLRGGSWSDLPQYHRSAVRSWYPRDLRSYSVGFRVARTHVDD